jgi:hypothetical protein
VQAPAPVPLPLAIVPRMKVRHFGSFTGSPKSTDISFGQLVQLAMLTAVMHAT